MSAILGLFISFPRLYRYIAIALIAVGAYWFVWDTGRGFERGRWEAATQVEQDRQRDIAEASREASEVAAGVLLSMEAERSKLLRRLKNEASHDPGADNACLTPAGSLRLNSVGDQADVD